MRIWFRLTYFALLLSVLLSFAPFAALAKPTHIFVLKADPKGLPENPVTVNELMARSRAVLTRRLEQSGVHAPVIKRRASDQLTVKIAAKESRRLLVEALAPRRVLSFMLVDELSAPDDVSQGRAKEGSIILPMADGLSSVALRQLGAMSGDYIENAIQTFDQFTNSPVINVRFNAVGTQKFGSLTSQNVGKMMAIVLDGKILSMPRINEPIFGGTAQIAGGFSVIEAQQFAATLQAGLLPLDFKIIQERTQD